MVILLAGCSTNRMDAVAIGMSKDDITNKIGRPDNIAFLPKTEKISVPIYVFHIRKALIQAAAGHIDAAKQSMALSIKTREIDLLSLNKNELDDFSTAEKLLDAAILEMNGAITQKTSNEEDQLALKKATGICERADRLLVKLQPKNTVYEKVDIDVEVQSGEKQEYWIYYGQKAESYQTFAIIFDDKGKYLYRQVLGYNNAQYKVDSTPSFWEQLAIAWVGHPR